MLNVYEGDFKGSQMPEDSPICTFGPGGDYKKDYTPEPETEKDGLIMKAISCVADSLITRVAESDKETAGEDKKTEKKLTDTKKDRDTAVHKTVSRTKSIPADNQGVGRTPSKKRNNRVRALRKPSRRRFSVVNQPEGTLFGAN